MEKSIEAAPLPVEVSVRPIVPQGSLKGFASVKIGAVEIDDFKVMDGKNGMFLSPPSKEAPGTRRGYRSTTRVLDRGLQERLDALTRDAYAQAVESWWPRGGPAAHPYQGTAGGGGKGGGTAQRQPQGPRQRKGGP